MPKKPSRPSFATLDPQKIKAICDTLEGDGHGIYSEAMFDDLGIPTEYIGPLLSTYQSDPRNHKATIYAPGGAAIRELRGVYSLVVYETIAADLGLPGSLSTGRGFRAQECHAQIVKWCIDRMSGKPPVCHEREMIGVKNEKNEPIWWCADCGNKMPRTEDDERTD